MNFISEKLPFMPYVNAAAEISEILLLASRRKEDFILSKKNILFLLDFFVWQEVLMKTKSGPKILYLYIIICAHMSEKIKYAINTSFSFTLGFSHLGDSLHIEMEDLNDK